MKYAIVTGASKGVGRETAILLSISGYKVIAVSRNIEKLNNIVSKNIEVYQLDITNFSEIKKFWEVYSNITLDLLVNNAGGGSNPTSIENETPENFNYAYSLNVSGPMYLSKLFAPNLCKAEAPTIVFVSSLGGKFPYRGGGNYTTAKRGLGGLVETMRMEFSQYGIRVTEICPGSIDTVEGQSRDIAIKGIDMAKSILWVSELEKHVNINYLEINHLMSGRY